VVGSDTLYPGYSTPAKPNETIQIYAVGFGLPNGTITAGSSSQTGTLPANPACTVGGNPASVAFAGLISPGLYQINLTIPGNASSGDNPIGCSYGGSATPVGDLVTVQQ